MGGGGEGTPTGANLTTYLLAYPCILSFVLSLLVKGDSYPEFCAQRTAEGE
jgi:hypothetical protein